MHNYTNSGDTKMGPRLTKKITCSIVGARGYTGLETARLLLQHPFADLISCFATSGFKLDSYLANPKASQVQCHADAEMLSHLAAHPTEVVFLATPAEVSMKLTPELVKMGKKVIDLSGAFRLKKNDYQKWYGFEHTEATLLNQANYGLLPWAGPFNSSLANSSALIANPGCYATAISMALIPLLKDKIISPKNLVIDAKSGTSGAGKKAAENLLFTEVDGECLPYKVGKHQHLPEIIEAIEAFSGQVIDAHFSTSLLATRRGIIASIFAQLNEGFEISDLENCFAKFYGDCKLVSHSPIKNNSGLLSLKKVLGTAKTHISYEVVDSKVYLFSCIDNLMKGAASQAIENFNRISDLPTSTGLSHLEAII
jgi:N-acetyl-gamma-glutamyl-phosphate reductase